MIIDSDVHLELFKANISIPIKVSKNKSKGNTTTRASKIQNV